MRLLAILLTFSAIELTTIIRVLCQRTTTVGAAAPDEKPGDATSTAHHHHRLPKTVHLSRELGSRTDYSGKSNEIYSSSNRFKLSSTRRSGTPFEAEKFFNDSRLVSNGTLNVNEVRRKLDNGSGHVMPVNDTSATFQIPGKTNDDDDGGVKRDRNESTNGIFPPLNSTATTAVPVNFDKLNVTSILASDHDLDIAPALMQPQTSTVSSLDITSPTHMPSSNVTSTTTHVATKNNSAPNTNTQMGSNASNASNTSAQMRPNITFVPSTNEFNTSISATYTMEELEKLFGPVIYSSVYFTNGAITPKDSNLKDRSNSMYWKIGSDQLTNIGKSQMYDLGIWLADRYLRLLNGTMYEGSITKVDSAGTDCSFMSAECVLAGLFPPEGNEVWNKAIDWQPIPINEVPTDKDEVIAMTMPCRQYDTEVNNANEQHQWKELYQTYRGTFDILSNNTGYKFTETNIFFGLQRVFDYYNDFRIMIDDGLSLPSWARNIYPTPMATLAVEYLKMTTYTKTMQKFKAGPFLNEVINNMKKSTTGSSNEKLHLYSGTVMGLSAIMSSLKIFNSLIPPYASALLIELHNKTGGPIVIISYKNSSTQSPYTMMIPNCEHCTLSQFTTVTEDVIPSNWDEECNIISIGNLTYSTPLLIAGLIVILVLIFLFILLLIKFCKCISKKKARISYNK